MKTARRLQGQLTEVIGADAPRAVFMGRVGAGKPAMARSVRKPLTELMR
jgi:hypothetical protein